MKNVVIIGNREKSGCEDAVKRAADFLSGKANVVGIFLEKEVALPETSIDLVISLGGDGSFLNLVEAVITRDIPIIGINFGRLGFLTAAVSHELETIISAAISNDVIVSERLVLQMKLENKNAEPLIKHALNDVIVAGKDLSRVTELYIKISEEPLIEISGDGLILSTPTGSTAHSLSAGGSVVDPLVDAILLTPLSPQSLSSRPLVVRPDVTIEVGICGEDHAGNIMCDGRHLGDLSAGSRILISKSPKSIKMVQPKDFMFFHRLRQKLGWSDNFLTRS